MLDLPEDFATFDDAASPEQLAHIEKVLRSKLPDWARALVERGCIRLGDLRIWLAREFHAPKDRYPTPGFYPLGLASQDGHPLHLFVDVRGAFSSTHGAVLASPFTFPKSAELSLVAADGPSFIAWAQGYTEAREARDAARTEASSIAEHFPEGFLGVPLPARISPELLDGYLGEARAAVMPPVLRALLLEGWSGLGDELVVLGEDLFRQFHVAPPPMPEHLKGSASPAAALLGLVYEDTRHGLDGVLFFATDAAGRPLAWDADGTLGGERGAVFLVPQDGADPEPLASSFDAFVEATLEAWLAENG